MEMAKADCRFQGDGSHFVHNGLFSHEWAGMNTKIFPKFHNAKRADPGELFQVGAKR
jgi:hypothetical protein